MEENENVNIQDADTNPQEPANNNTDPQESGKETNGIRLAGEAGKAEKGAPETYDFTSSLPEGETLDENISREFGNICKEMNLTNEEANKIASYGFEYAKGIARQIAEQQEVQINSWAEETKKELGANFTETMNHYGTGLQYMEKTMPNIRQILNETGAGNRIEIVKAFAELGKLISEDGGAGGGNRGGGTNTTLYPNTDFSNY